MADQKKPYERFLNRMAYLDSRIDTHNTKLRIMYAISEHYMFLSTIWTHMWFAILLTLLLVFILFRPLTTIEING
jgi:hypothetical protein